MGLLEETKELLDQAVALRRRIHRHPEIGLDLPRTRDAVLDGLDGLPLTVRTGSRCSSVVAVLEGARPGPTVLLRGDMDALPMPEDTGLEFASEVDGAMHACGHDAHVAMLVSAARLLAARRQDLPGRVLFMFQPGEEGYRGARVMIEEGLLDGENAPSAAFALHVNPYLPSGQVSTRPGAAFAASDRIEGVVRGRGGHASAPHRALDPIVVACEIVTALQTQMTRQTNVFDPAVLTIAHVAAGTTNNVIPETAWFEGTVRTLTPQTRAGVLERARRLVEGVAAAHGLGGELVVDEGYPATVNDPDMAEFALRVAGDVLGPSHVARMETPQMGAEDFSYVLQRVPGAMLRLGAAVPGVADPAPNHSNRMVIHEPAMAHGIALHAALAIRYLEEGTEGGVGW